MGELAELTSIFSLSRAFLFLCAPKRRTISPMNPLARLSKSASAGFMPSFSSAADI